MMAFSLDSVERVEFFKRDRVTTDLICCRVTFGGDHWLEWDEDMPDWRGMLALLERLPGFDRNWYSKVSQPPFEPSYHIAFARHP